MRSVVGLVVHIKLAVVILARRVVVIGDPLVGKLIETIDVLQRQGFGCIPRRAELGALLIKDFNVKTIGRSADITAADVVGEYALVVSCEAFF